MVDLGPDRGIELFTLLGGLALSLCLTTSKKLLDTRFVDSVIRSRVSLDLGQGLSRIVGLRGAYGGIQLVCLTAAQRSSRIE
jgi:hypothetical protein